MRLLIVAMLLCASVGFGQDVYNLADPIVAPSGPKLLTVQALCTYWQEYSDSCYEDSTQIWTQESGWVGFDVSTGVAYNDGLYHSPYRIWTHREPTFPGFIAWLRKEKKP